MKKTGFVLLLGGVMAACTNSGSPADVRLDSIGQKFDSSAARIWDSTKGKAKDIKERIEQKLEGKDSVYQNEDTTKH